MNISAKIEIRLLDEGQFLLWDELVDQAPQGTLFHKSFWLKALGKEVVIYGYFRGKELLAGIPLICTKRLGNKLGVHPPLTPYLGILFRRQDAKYVDRISKEKRISQAIVARLKKDFSFVGFIFPVGAVDLQPFLWQGFSARVKFTYILNLDSSLDDIWAGMSETRRRNIRKAEKDGLTAVPNDDFDLSFNLVEKTFARQGMKTVLKQAAFASNEALRARNQCKSFLTKDKDGVAIAAVYIVWDHKRSYYLLGGYDAAKSHYGASALAMWEAIKFSKEELGVGEFDFEGSMIPSVERFFRPFGGRLTPVYTVFWIKRPVWLRRLARRVLRMKEGR